MLQLSEVIKGIHQTEKATRLERARQYILRVDPSANKLEIKRAAETFFKVSVTKVNTQRVAGKWKRLTGRWGKRPEWKKAIVTVAQGQKIELK